MNKIIYCCLCLFLVSTSVDAQRIRNYKREKVQGLGTTAELYDNAIKLNLTPLQTKTLSVQYERFLRGKNTICLGLRVTPRRGLPYRDQIVEAFNDGATGSDIATFYDNLRFSTVALTPEYRHYFGRQVARGFYIGGFGRYEHIRIKGSNTFTRSDLTQLSYNFLGRTNRVGAGFQLGAQFKIKQRFLIDWWIAGPMGTYNSSYIGAKSPDFGLSNADITDFLTTYQALDFAAPILGKLGVIATNNELAFTNKGFGASLRTGLCVGYRFGR
jgi:hypothetical protein